jgi:hypothetical protein
MAISNFPSYIFINDLSLTREIRNNVLRSENEVGPQKTRPVACKPMFQIQFTVNICDEDFQNYLTWFRQDLSYGSNWFLMNDPFDGIKKRFRFVNTQISFQKSNHLYQATFLIESYDG